MSGGSSTDFLSGGGGQDYFFFIAPAPGPPSDSFYGLEAVITDFESHASDAVNPDFVEIALLAGTGEWIGSAEFDSSGTPQARFDEEKEVVEVDGSGNGINNFDIKILGVSSAEQLTSTDFLFSE